MPVIHNGVLAPARQGRTAENDLVTDALGHAFVEGGGV